MVLSFGSFRFEPTTRFSHFLSTIAVFVSVAMLASIALVAAQPAEAERAGWLQASFDENSSVVRLSWEPPRSDRLVAGYNIHRGTVSAGSDVKVSYHDTVRGANSFNDVDINAGSSYRYQVTPIWGGDGEGFGQRSEPLEVVARGGLGVQRSDADNKALGQESAAKEAEAEAEAAAKAQADAEAAKAAESADGADAGGYVAVPVEQRSGDRLVGGPLVPAVGLSVSDNVAGGVVLEWGSSPGQKFNVDRALGSVADKGKKEYVTTVSDGSNRFVDSKAVAGQEYTYWVYPTAKIDGKDERGERVDLTLTVPAETSEPAKEQDPEDATGSYVADPVEQPDPAKEPDLEGRILWKSRTLLMVQVQILLIAT